MLNHGPGAALAANFQLARPPTMWSCNCTRHGSYTMHALRRWSTTDTSNCRHQDTMDMGC